MSTAAAAVALTTGFQQVDQVDEYNGCVIRIGRALENGVQPLRAECHWSDVTASDVEAVLRQYDGYGRFIDVIKESKVLREETERALVWQFSKPGYGLAARESEVWIDRLLEGDWSILWGAAPEPFTPRPGSVVMPRNEGVWTVAPAGDGGADVVQYMVVDPGGSVPLFVVNWFQTCGVKEELGKLRALAQAVTP